MLGDQTVKSRIFATGTALIISLFTPAHSDNPPPAKGMTPVPNPGEKVTISGHRLTKPGPVPKSGQEITISDHRLPKPGQLPPTPQHLIDAAKVVKKCQTLYQKTVSSAQKLENLTPKSPKEYMNKKLNVRAVRKLMSDFEGFKKDQEKAVKAAKTSDKLSEAATTLEQGCKNTASSISDFLTWALGEKTSPKDVKYYKSWRQKNLF